MKFKERINRFKCRRSIIKDLKSLNLSSENIKKYVHFIIKEGNQDYIDSDEYATKCSFNNKSNVYEISIKSPEIVITINILGQSIVVKITSIKSSFSSINRTIEFSYRISNENIYNKSNIDMSETVNIITECICNSLLYTVKKYTNRW